MNDQLRGYCILQPSVKVPLRLELPHEQTWQHFTFCATGEEKVIDSCRVIVLGDIRYIRDTAYALSEWREKQEALVVALYQKHGEGFSTHLEGAFLICLYDETQQEVFLITNRDEATRLYYYYDESLFACATTLQELLSLLPFAPSLDSVSLPSFLKTGFSHTEKTQFQHIFRLLPTCRLRIGAHAVSVAHHWQDEYRFRRSAGTNPDEALQRYEKLYRTSIRQFVDSARPREVGCFLSGGHDTSYTFIQATKVCDKPVHAFTACFEDFGFDESPKAKFLTGRFGGVHHRVPIGQADLDYVPELVRLAEEPVPGGAFPMFACIRKARGVVDALIAGDAGDTLWGEYYPVAEWHRYLRWVPSILRKGFYAGNRLLLKWCDWERLYESEHVFSLFAQKHMYKDFFERLCTYRHFNAPFLRELLDPGVFPAIQTHTSLLDVPVGAHNFFDALVETKMLYGVYQYMIPVTQKPIEAYGMRYYSPYLSKSLRDFINALPESWLNDGSSFRKLINDAHKRKFHKYALLQYLPKRFVYSVQQSMDVPFHAFLPKRPRVLEALLKRLKKRGWYNEQKLEEIFNEFPRQKVKPYELCELKHHGYRIFCLLTYEVWCMEFLDKMGTNQDKKNEIIPLEEYLSV